MTAPTTFFCAGDLGEFNNAHNGTVTSSSQAFTPDGPYKRYCVYVDTDTHLALNRAATTNDFLLKAGGYVFVHIDTDANAPAAPNNADITAPSINWIEDSADGHIQITECGARLN